MKLKTATFKVNLLVLLLLLSNLNISVAQSHISNVDIEFDDNLIKVPYEIVIGSENDMYVVSVDFYDEDNRTIHAESIDGDIGFVTGVGSKLITWDVTKDGLLIDENIRAHITAKLIPGGDLTRAIAYSTVFPGLGNYQYKTGKPYWLKGVLGYGLIGGAITTVSLSANSYDKYLDSNLHSTEDPHYREAQQFRRTSLILGGLGLAVWLVDYVGLISKDKQHRNLRPQEVIEDTGFKEFTESSPLRHINTGGRPAGKLRDVETDFINKI